MDRAISAIFLDRDGVINVNRPDHVKSWSEFQFLPGVLEALALLNSAGLPVFVITNQAVINRGLVKPKDIDDINSRMKSEVERHGGRIEAVLCCPHAPEEDCYCRKPRPGLLMAAARNFCLDLRRCLVVGDALTDVQAAQAVGCEAIMVLTGRGVEQHRMALRSAHNGYRLARDLREAVSIILTKAVVLEMPAGNRA